ncbi:MAG: hypothetical protein R3C11_15035 [Planctomycetaceae bacterium]
MSSQPGLHLSQQMQIVAQLVKHGRLDQAKAIYEEMHEKASSLQDIYALLNLEIGSKIYERSFSLMNRFLERMMSEKDQNQNWIQYYSSFTRLFERMMYELKNEEKEDEFLKLFEMAIRFYKDNPPQLHQQSQQMQNYQLNAYYNKNLLRSGAIRQSVRVMTNLNQVAQQDIDYPLANETLNISAIHVLYNFYYHSRTNPVRMQGMSDLIQAECEKAENKDQAYYHLVASALAWWDNRPETATLELEEALAALDQVNFQTRLNVVVLYQNQGRDAEALAAIEKEEPENFNDLQLREMVVLNIASKTGDTERARLAAERLSSMRLDFQVRMELANKLKSLGMDDLAGTTLIRSRQQAGNNESHLFQLMQSFQADNIEVAAEIAMQILQLHKPRNQNSAANLENFQRQAVEVLKSTGRLIPLISETEEKLTASPKSIEILEKLIVYLDATGNLTRKSQLEERLLELKPLGPHELLQRAEQANSKARYDESVKYYQKLAEVEPQLIGQRFYNISQTFYRSGNLEAFYELMQKIDLQKYVRVQEMADLFRNFRSANNYQRKNNEREVFRLLEFCWDKYKHERLELLRGLQVYLSTDDYWKTPEIKKYLQEAFLTTIGEDGNQLSVSEIQPIRPLAYMADGGVITLYDKLFESFDSQEELRQYRQELNERIEKYPSGINEKLLLCMLDVKLGQTEGIVNRLEEIHLIKLRAPIVNKWAVAKVLAEVPELKSYAIGLYESIRRQEEYQAAYQRGDRSRRVEKTLVRLYHEQGDNQQALSILLEELKHPMQGDSNERRSAANWLRYLDEISREFEKIGFLSEAWLLNHQILIDRSELLLGEPYLGKDFEKNLQQHQIELTMKIEPEQFLKTLQADYLNKLYRISGYGFPFPVQQLIQSEKSEAGEKQIQNAFLNQFRILLGETGIDKEQVDTTHIDASHTEKQRVAAQGLLNAFQEYLAQKETDHPEEGIWLITRKMLQTLDAEMEFTPPELETLKVYLTQMTFERPRVLQKQDDPSAEKFGDPTLLLMREKQLILCSCWLIAEKLWQQEQTRPQAMEISSQILDTTFGLKQDDLRIQFLLKRGRELLRSGDKEAAEKDWRKVLELIFSDEVSLVDLKAITNPQPANSTTTKTGSTQKLEGPNKADTTSIKIVPASKPLPYPKFEQVLHLAQLAAEEGMPQFSIDAIRAGLKKGLPLYEGELIPVYIHSDWTRLQQVRYLSESWLFERLLKMEPHWVASNLDPAVIDQLYWDIVFPQDAPGTMSPCVKFPLRDRNQAVQPLPPNPQRIVVSYSLKEEDQSTQEEQSPEPLSLSQHLLFRKLAQNKADEYATELKEQLQYESIELPVRIALLELAARQGQYDQIEEQLDQITPLLEKDCSQFDVRDLCSVLIPLIDVSWQVEKILPIYEAAVDSLKHNLSNEPVASALLYLSQYYSKEHDIAGLTRTFRTQVSYLRKSAATLDRDLLPQGASPTAIKINPMISAVYTELILQGDLALSLEYLGVLSDAMDGDMLGLQGPLTFLDSQLRQLPAEARYSLLHDWAFPKTDKKPQYRHLSGFLLLEMPPSHFFTSFDRQDKKLDSSREQQTNIFDTTYLLWETAVEVGKEQELVTALSKHLPANDNLNLPHYFVEMREPSEHQAARFDLFCVQLIDLLKSNREHMNPEQMLIVIDAIQQPELRVRTENLLADIQTLASGYARYSRANATRLRSLLWECDRIAKPDQLKTTETGMPFWVESTQSYFEKSLENEQRPIWFGQNEFISHLASAGDSFLFFKYPLTGDFEFSMESLNDSWSEGHLAYGGLNYQLELSHQGRSGELGDKVRPY